MFVTTTNVRRRAVTLIELLVVVLILTLLATAATPVFVGQIQQARLATARFEVDEIAKAQQLCALAHSVYVPLQVLDDLPPKVGGPAPPAGTDDLENSIAGGQILLVEVARNSLDMQANGQKNLANWATLGGLTEQVYRGWRGPFLQPQRVWAGTDGINDRDDDTDQRFDHPLDPWGNPYRFFSPEGVLGTSASSVTTTSYSTNSFSDGAFTTTLDRFDRYAIVSLGPDGIFDTGTTADDDIIFLFGIDPNETTFRF